MTTKINIRICNHGDENALALLGQATFLETFAGMMEGHDILTHSATNHSAEVYRAWLEQPDVKIWLAEMAEGNAPIGYLVLVPAKLPLTDLQPADLEIKRLYLLHRFQGSGLGKRLMQEALNYAGNQNCNRLVLEVYSPNTKAIMFYQKFGFKKVSKRSFKVVNNYYEHTAMQLIM